MIINIEKFLNNDELSSTQKFALQLLHKEKFEDLDAFLENNNIKLENLLQPICNKLIDNQIQLNSLYSIVNDLKSIKYLLSKGTELNLKFINNEEVNYGELLTNSEIIKEIFNSKNISIESKHDFINNKENNKLGWNCSHILINIKDPDIIKVLTDYGAQFNYSDLEGVKGHVLGDSIIKHSELLKQIVDFEQEEKRRIYEFNSCPDKDKRQLLTADLIKFRKENDVTEIKKQMHNLEPYIKIISKYDIDRKFDFFNHDYNNLKLMNMLDEKGLTPYVEQIIKTIQNQKPIYNYVDMKRLTESIDNNNFVKLTEQINFIKDNVTRPIEDFNLLFNSSYKMSYEDGDDVKKVPLVDGTTSLECFKLLIKNLKLDFEKLLSPNMDIDYSWQDSNDFLETLLKQNSDKELIKFISELKKEGFVNNKTSFTIKNTIKNKNIINDFEF